MIAGLHGFRDDFCMLRLNMNEPFGQSAVFVDIDDRLQPAHTDAADRAE